MHKSPINHVGNISLVTMIDQNYMCVVAKQNNPSLIFNKLKFVL